MKIPWKCRLSSNKVIVPKCYNSNPYRPFASFQYVMAIWNGKVCNVKKSWTYILTTKSIVSQFLNLDFMKVTVKKVCWSSTLPKTTIASSTSLKYFKILSFKITLETNLLDIWVVNLQSCGGFMATSLLDCMVVIKKLD